MLALVRGTESPLKRQLLIVGLIGKLLRERGKELPTIIGGCALSYYSRDVYFTADIDLAYSDREGLNDVLLSLGFSKSGRYWVSDDLAATVEVPASVLAGEESSVEEVDLGNGLMCRIIGIEDLIIDRLNACKHWRSSADCEMAELLVRRYVSELDWRYLENKAAGPDNEVLEELSLLRAKVSK